MAIGAVIGGKVSGLGWLGQPLDFETYGTFDTIFILMNRCEKKRGFGQSLCGFLSW